MIVMKNVGKMIHRIGPATDELPQGHLVGPGKTFEVKDEKYEAIAKRLKISHPFEWEAYDSLKVIKDVEIKAPSAVVEEKPAPVVSKKTEK